MLLGVPHSGLVYPRSTDAVEFVGFDEIQRPMRFGYWRSGVRFNEKSKSLTVADWSIEIRGVAFW